VWKYQDGKSSNWFAFCCLFPCYMKGPARHNYKALYQQCSRQSTDKDRLIALLQSQTTQLASERQMKDHTIASQQQQLAGQVD
jgi:hypothetical protein